MNRTPKTSKEPGPGLSAGVFSGGVLAMVAVCCGGHTIILGALGGAALGGVFGVGIGALAAVVLVAALVVVRRRRAATCTRPSSDGVSP